MKKITILSVCTLLSVGLRAQPWMSGKASHRRLKDIISEHKDSAHEAKEREEDKDAPGKPEADEDENYHFDRWAWYWQQHLDKDGKMVSPLKTFREWRDYQAKQKLHSSLAKTTNTAAWVFNGPTHSPGMYSGLGRINVVSFHPTDSNTFIVGSAGGGAWRTTNGGLNWSSLYDNLPVLGVSDVVYNPQNPATIYLCTGDKDAGDTYTVGLLRSYDNGTTWDTTGLQFDVTDYVLIRNMVINKLDTNSMMVASTEGIKKSNDGGHTWSTVLPGDFKQVVYSTADTNIVFAAGDGGPGTGNVYRSTDGGQNWQATTNFNGGGTLRLAVTAADPAIVKIVVTTNDYSLKGIYSSTDTGASFVKLYGNANDCSTNILTGSLTPDNTTCGGQAWYDLCITISPVDPNIVVVGGVNTWYSINGGSDWSMITQWYYGLPGIMTVHADKHYLIYHPLRPQQLFECNDGGIYRTSAPTTTLWNHLTNGMGITQFYRNAVADAASFVLGGAQDNGTKRLNGTTGQASDETGGDGMDCHIDYSDPNIYYTSYQYGSFSRTINNGGAFSDISQNVPGNPTGEWITPFQINPVLPEYVFVGFGHLFMSTTRGDDWTDISPTLSQNTNIRRIAMSPADAETVYILKNDISIWRTTDLGGNWTPVSVPYPNEYITDIQADPHDASHLWVVFGGYTGKKVADYKPGVGWALHDQGLPDIPAACMAIDSSNGTLYLGTDVAVFYKATGMNSWALYNDGLPNISVTDLGINYATNEIWASTFGRGMWHSPRFMEDPTSVNNIPMALDVISVSPNPTNGQFTVHTNNVGLMDQAVDVRIIGSNGSMAWHGALKFQGGSMPVNAASLSKGTYVLEVGGNGALFARTKLIIY